MKLTENVHMLDSVKGSHVFLVTGRENILIDTGMPGNAGRIAGELRSLGLDMKSIGKILLTHHDVDHIGSAEAIRQASGAELWAPALDVPFIKGETKRPGVKGVISALMCPVAPAVTGTFDSRRDFDGIRAVFAPGHTPGHTIFQYGSVVFAGDLLRHLKGRFSMLPSYMNWYLKATRESIGLLKTLDFDWLCPAHGDPVKRDKELDKFLEGF
jgi:glyoxylase-like metal-dependent hydrolase (beta-lactamase superfamily II)